MPVVRFEGQTVVVTEQEQVEEAVEYLNAQKIVGVDTESRPAFHKGERFPVSLVQIATEEKCFLFRLRVLGMPDALVSVFTNPNITKVGLAFKDDIEGLRRLRRFKPQGCVDVQSMVNNYGIFELGLQKLFAILYGKKISKSQQLTNWDNAVLTPDQARYASTDAWATLLIYNKLLSMERLPAKMVEEMKKAEHVRLLDHQRQVQEEKGTGIDDKKN